MNLRIPPTLNEVLRALGNEHRHCAGGGRLGLASGIFPVDREAIFFFPTTLFTALFARFGPACAGIAIFTVVAHIWVLPPPM